MSREPSDELLPSNHIVPIVVLFSINDAVCNEFVNVLAAESRELSRFSYGKHLMRESCFPFCVQTIVWILEVFLVIVYHIIKICFIAGMII